MWLWGQFPKFRVMSENIVFAFVQMKKYHRMVSKKDSDLR